MSLVDVSKEITQLERKCRFAEWFTRSFREPLAEALRATFVPRAGEDQPPDALPVVDSLVERLRSTFDDLSARETQLLAFLKREGSLRTIRDRRTSELRQAFRRARGSCRDTFGFDKASEAGFPSRLAEDPLPLLRQTQVVSWVMRSPKFDLGESLIPTSSLDAEGILGIFEPQAEALRTSGDFFTEQKGLTSGKQSEKDKAMGEFQTTYSLFVNMLRSSFRLAGMPEMAKRLTLPDRSPASSSDPGGDPLSDGGVLSETPEESASSDTASENAPASLTGLEAPVETVEVEVLPLPSSSVVSD